MTGPSYPVTEPWFKTIISQYANSAILVALIATFWEAVDQEENFDEFYNKVWNVDTAEGWGLDVWGRIVGVPRTIPVPGADDYFGFEGSGFEGFNQAPFYSGANLSQNVTLSDAAYRVLIIAKALANISDGSIPSINQILLTLFPDRGNCFSGETEILTDRGYVNLRSMAGRSAKILSPVSGRFERAKIKSFGIQPVNEVTICNASRRGPAGSFARTVTPDHRWILQDGSTTTDLKIGDLLMAGHSAIESDINGWVHGFVVGDGSRDRPGEFRVRLCGQKDQRHLMRFLLAFPEATVRYAASFNGDPRVRIKSPIDLKALPPDNAKPEYLRGFVEGLLEADGCFSSRGDDPFQFHGSERLVRWIRDRLILADFAPCGAARLCHAGSTNYGPRSEPLWRQYFRRTNTHKGFRVLDIHPAGIAEVFCAEEPKYHQITMRDGLRTSNCYVTDGEDMTMTYTFDFELTPAELSIVSLPGLLAKPAGVSATIVTPP